MIHLQGGCRQVTGGQRSTGNKREFTVVGTHAFQTIATQFLAKKLKDAVLHNYATSPIIGLYCICERDSFAGRL